jgi:FkbM family methyltransferase
MGEAMESLCKAGDLVFDIGANIGAKTELYVNKGARVVCFEPQPGCLEALRERFRNQPLVTIVPKGIAAERGSLTMSICEEAPTISTFSETWKRGRFSAYRWRERVSVDVITLDEAVEQHGVPSFCKIDVEGFELEVLRGLSRKAGTLSFEFTREFISVACQCVAQCTALGYSSYNYVLGEGTDFMLPHWVDTVALFSHLQANPDDLLWGDIYAR